MRYGSYGMLGSSKSSLELEEEGVMSQPVNKVPLKERNNQPQGRSGSGTPMKNGPAVGHTSGNATSKGGINRATKGL